MDVNALRAQVDYVMDTSSLDAGTAKVKAHGDAAAATAAKVEIFQRQTTIQEQSVTRVASKLDAYTRSIDPLQKALAQAERGERLLAAARAQGLPVTDAQIRAVDAARAKYDQLSRVQNDNTRATGLQRYEWINLSRQLQDVGVSLAGGQNPLLVLVQQGSQIADVFSTSRGGAAAALAEFGAAALRVASNPLTILAATLGTITLGAHSASQRLAELADMSRLYGFDMNTMLGARVAGARVGLDQDKTSQAFVNASQEFEAFSRNSGAVKDTLEKLGGNFLNVADRARNAGEFIDRVGSIIRRLPVTEGRDLAEKLFGPDAGKRFYDNIRDGSLSMASLAMDAKNAGTALAPAAQHALELRREIEATNQIAETRMLAAFGRLSDPIAELQLQWAKLRVTIADVVDEIRHVPAIQNVNDAHTAGREIARLRSGGLPARQEGQSIGEYNALMRNNRIGTLLPIGSDIPANAGDLRERLLSGQFSAPYIDTITGDDESAGLSRARYAAREEARKLAARHPHAHRARHHKEARSNPIDAFIGSLRDDQNYAESDYDTRGANDTERAKARALSEAENIARREGVKITNAQRLAISSTVEETQRLKGETERYNKTMQETVGLFRDSFSSGLGSFLSDLEHGKRAGDALNDSLRGVLDNVQKLALSRLTSSLFGDGGKGGDGLFGSLFGDGGKGDGKGGGALFGGLFGSFGKGFAGMFADGGPIPAGQFGIAGERGPEIIAGPATVFPSGKGPGGGGVVVHNYAAGVDVTPQITPAGVALMIRSAIQQNNAQLPATLAGAGARQF